MKRFVNNIKRVILLPVVFCALLSGCAEDVKEEVALKKDDTNVIFCVDEMVNGHRVLIPEFESKVDSSVVQEINMDIENLLIGLYEGAKADSSIDPMVITDVYDGEQYLQTVSRYVEYPLLGSDGDVVSYNYDRIHDQRLLLSDALIMSDITLDDLKQEIVDLYLGTDEAKAKNLAMYAMTVNAFHIQEDGHVIYWGKLVISENEQNPWGYTYSYDYDTKELRILQEGE